MLRKVLSSLYSHPSKYYRVPFQTLTFSFSSTENRRIQASYKVTSPSQSSKKSKKGTKVAPVIGGILGVTLCLVLPSLYYLRRKRNSSRNAHNPSSSITPYDTSIAQPLEPVKISTPERRRVSFILESGGHSGLVHNPATSLSQLEHNNTRAREKVNLFSNNGAVTPPELLVPNQDSSNGNSLAAAAGTNTSRSTRNDEDNTNSDSEDDVVARGAAAKQTLVNERLLNDVDDLRQTVERLQAESSRSRPSQVRVEPLDDHPPSYTNIVFVP